MTEHTELPINCGYQTSSTKQTQCIGITINKPRVRVRVRVRNTKIQEAVVNPGLESQKSKKQH